MKTKTTIFLIILTLILISAIYILSQKFLTKTNNLTIQQFNNNQPNNSDNAIKQPDTKTTTQPKQTTSTPQSMTEIVRADTKQQQVVFTFDAGSGNQSLDTVLAALAKYNLQTSFFITGQWTAKYPNGVKKIAAAGQEIFNHTYSHPHLTQISDEQIIDELTRTDNIISGLTGQSTKPYFRPPYGDRNQHVRDVAASLGYRSVYWTVDTWDWRESDGVTAARVRARILDNLAPGNIYLMHLGDNITGQILDEMFSKILNQGYQIAPLSTAL